MTARNFRSSSLLELNLVKYLRRELVNAGFYFNVASGHLSIDGQRGDVLRRVNSNVYESFVDRWVMETDMVGLAGAETVDPSGVYVDDVFHPKGAAPYEPAIDFERGRVVFEGSGLPASAEVRMGGFSYEEVAVDLPDSQLVSLLFSEIRDNADLAIHAFPSGSQRQLPMVIVDLQNSFNLPGELGGTKNRDQLIVLHVLGTDRHRTNSITDFVSERLFRKTIKGVDFNETPPLITANGDRAITYVNYTDLQASGAVEWQKIYIDEARVRERATLYDLLRNRVDLRIRLYFLPPDGG